MLVFTCSLLAWCVTDLWLEEADLRTVSRELKLGAIDYAVVIVIVVLVVGNKTIRNDCSS